MSSDTPLQKVLDFNLKSSQKELDQFKFKEWDCDPINWDQFRFLKTLNLKTIGFTLTDKDLPFDFKVEQYEQIRAIFSDMTAEMFCRCSEEISSMLPSGKRFEDMHLGTKTPDLMFPGTEVDLPGIIYEFKSTLGSADETRIQQMREETDQKYSNGKWIVRMIHLKLSAKFPSLIKLGKNASDLYHTVRNELLRMIHKVKDRRILFRESPRLILNIFDRISSILSDEEKLGVHGEYVDYFHSDYLPSWVEAIKVFEKFYDENYMNQTDASKICLEFLTFKRPNISSERMWDRDYNREKYAAESSNPEFGHRASYLMFWPVHKNLVFGDFSAERLIGYLDSDPLFWSILSSSSVSGRSIEIIKSVLNVHQTHEFVFKQIKELSRRFGFLLTESSRKDFEEQGTTLKDELRKLAEEQKNVLTQANNNRSKRWKITRHGFVRVDLTEEESYYMGINRNTDRHFKTEESHIDWEQIDFKFELVEQDFPIGEGFNVPLQDFYVKNTSLNDECNLLLINSKNKLDTLFRTRQFGALQLIQKFERGLLAAFPPHTRKKVKHNDFALFAIPEVSALVLCTAPVGITSGVIIVICLLTKGTRFHESYVPYEYVDLPDYTIAVSSPFRVQMDIVQKRDEMIASWVSLCAMSSHYECELHTNSFFNSFWWSYTRMESLALDIVYLLLKNAINFGTLGKRGYVKKFEGLIVNDVRVATVIKNLWSRYRLFSLEMQDYVANRGGDMLNLKDPVFGMLHKSIQTLMIIIYMKQIVPKHDAFDESYVGMKHFFNEWEFCETYDNSDFNPKNGFDESVHQPMKDWLHKTVKGATWTPVSFHPDTCYFAVKKLVEEGLKKNPGLTSGNNFVDHKAMSTGKNSKVLMYDKLLPEALRKKVKQQTWKRTTFAVEVPEKGPATVKEIDIEAQEPGKLFGIQSIVLTEALTVNVLAFKKYIMKHKKELGLDEIPDDYIESYEPKLSELVWWHFLTSPRHTVLTIKVKDQKGYDKRIFFIQTADGRDKRKFADESFNALLNAIDEDMIMESGDEKNKRLEDKMRRLNFEFKNGVIITEDQTKYGDLYPLESFRCMIWALVDTGYFTKEQGDFVWSCVKNIKKRVILMPPEMKEMLRKRDKYEQLKPKDTLKGVRFWARFNLAERISKEPGVFEGFEEEAADFDELKAEIKKNSGIRKDVGFILGVFNKMGSTFSACQLWIQKYLFKILGLKGLVEGSTHSDDSIKFMGLPQPPILDMSKVKIDEALKMLLDGWKFHVSGNRQRVTMEKVINGRLESQLIDTAVLAKITQITSLICPRLIGQRPSTEKWGVGPSGEVLQLMSIAGKMIPPIMRFANAIGADLPGQSPANDLYSAVGRVYQLASNGMTTTCLSTMMIVANWFVFNRFGYKQSSLSEVNCKIPELGGFVWFYPPLILSTGFYSNDIRMLALAKNSRDKFLENQFKLMMDTEEVFVQKKLQAKVALSEEVSVEAVSSDNEGSAVSKKDFTIRYAKNIKAQYPFKVIGEEVRPMLEKFIDKLKQLPYPVNVKKELDEIKLEKKLSVFVRRLKNITTDRSLSHTGEFQDTMLSFLNRFVTPSYMEANLRIPEAVQLVNRIGYQRRQVPNQFSVSFMAKYDVKSKSVWLLQDVLNEILRIARGPPVNLPENTKLLNTIYRSRETMINELTWIKFSGMTIEKYDKDRDYELSWNKLQFNLSTSRYALDSSTVIAAYIQSEMMQLPFDRLPIVRAKPTLFASQEVIQRVQYIKSLLKNNGFSYRDVLRNPQVFSKIFEEKGYLGYCRGIYDHNEIRIMAVNNFDFGYRRFGKIEVLKTLRVKEFRNEVDVGLAFRALSVCYSISTFCSYPLSEIKMYDQREEPHSYQSLLQLLDSPWTSLGVNKQSCNMFILGNIIESDLKNKPQFSLYRYKSRNDVIVGCTYGTKHYFLELFSEGDRSAKFIAYTDNSYAPEVAFFLYAVSYFLLPQDLKIQDLSESIIRGNDDMGTFPGRGGFLSVGPNALETSNSLVNSAIRRIEPGQFHQLMGRCMKSSFFGNSYQFNYGTNRYMVQLWEPYKQPCGWRFETRDRQWVDRFNGLTEDDRIIDRFAIETRNNNAEVSYYNSTDVIIKKSVIVVNTFKMLASEGNRVNWGLKMYSKDANEILRFVIYGAKGWGHWVSFINLIDEQEVDEVDQRTVQAIANSSSLNSAEILLFTSKLLSYLSVFNPVSLTGVMKFWEVNSKLQFVNTQFAKSEMLQLYNKSFWPKSTKFADIYPRLKGQLGRIDMVVSDVEPNGYSSKLLELFIGMKNTQAAVMVKDALYYRPHLLQNGWASQEFKLTVWLNCGNDISILEALKKF